MGLVFNSYSVNHLRLEKITRLKKGGVMFWFVLAFAAYTLLKRRHDVYLQLAKL